MRRCNALWIGSAGLGVLGQGVIGKVHSVFERVLNVVTTDKGLISIAKCDVSKGPINIIVDLPSRIRMSSLGIQKGTRISRDGNMLLIGDKLVISLKNVRVWKPQKGVKETVKVEFIRNNLKLVKEFVKSKNDREG